MLYSGIIYKYISPSGKIYIGQTVNEARRKACHVYSSTKNPNNKDYNTPFHRAIRKYGIDSFIYSVEYKVIAPNKQLLKESLNYWEKFFIKLYNSKIPNGYNLTDGGDGILGSKMSEATITKMKKSHTGHKHSEETKIKMSQWQLGKKLSEETKRKISASHKGKSVSKGFKKCQAYKNGVLVATFESVKQAAEVLGVSGPAISKCLGNQKYTVKGFNMMYIK